ncbi:protein PAT1 homolog 1-like isoform X1 [Mya arenaria]|uniref:protein PAT1 homolog 1-like isoform X1 n=1 Tax=Mya arenaria TaxID=6604 RepID=UPI0022E4AA99|nr:protein PAT1 homolog 1-like isoform X1 [Mya arenaria]
MADACLDDYSALGSRVSSYDNQLLEAPEEEEDFDVLNEETFGDIGNAEFDWEEQTEKFAEVLESDRHNDSGFNTAEKVYRSHEEYMEQSISQLMVDDDDPDPAIVRSKPIPQRQQTLDSLFGPASPPSFLDAEQLMSPTSKNIWGSPLQESPYHPPSHVNNIQAMFDLAKSSNTVRSRVQSLQYSVDCPVAHIHGPHSKAPPMQLPKAQTLEEIENSLMRKPRILTAEELERQLRGESSAPPVRQPVSQTFSSVLQNGHRVSAAQYNVPPPALQGSPHSRMAPVSSMQGMVNGHRSPVFGGPPGLVGSAPSTPGRPPPPRGMPIPPVGSVAPGSPAMPVGTPPYRSGASPLNRQSPGTPGPGLSQPIGIPRGMRGLPPSGSPFSSPQAMVGSPQGPIQSPQQLLHRMPPPGSYGDNSRNNGNMMYQSSPHMQGPYNREHRQLGRSDHQQQHREHRYYRYPYNQKHESHGDHAPLSAGKRGSKDQDDYDGLMAQKEKDWIIKIQLLQLQTDNPLEDDYYYTSWCMRKKAREQEKEGGASNSKLVIPSMARMEHRAYKPAQFEGSLGRLTTSSVHNPRQIIDLLAKSMSDKGGAKTKSTVGKELRKSRQLLMDIEKGYNILLIIEDLETKILALPEDTAKPLLEERSCYVDLLFHYLLCDGNSASFMQYMNVRKGRSLTRRALPCLDKVQSVGIVSLVCKNLQQLMKKDQTDEHLEELFVPCASVIEGCNLATVVMFAEDIQQEDTPSTTKPIALALQNKFGSSILCALLHRGEKIYSTLSPVDLDSNLQNEWCEFVHEFAGILATLPLECIAAPLETYPDISEHLERLLNKRLLAVVEDNLDIFTQTRQS